MQVAAYMRFFSPDIRQIKLRSGNNPLINQYLEQSDKRRLVLLPMIEVEIITFLPIRI